MTEEREREYVGVGVCGGRERKAEMLKAESWGQGESVCGYVGVGGKERVQRRFKRA
jgi:hypothetical protein